MPHPHVVVIGAGAAGLAAAGALHEAHVPVTVLEARNRVGGRILSLHETATDAPIELGAEFVHGSADHLRPWLRQAGARTVDIGGTRWQAAAGRLRRVEDFWEQLDRVMRRMPSRRERDRSFAEFLTTKPGGRRLASERMLAEQYVRGVHAADTERISVHALATGGSPREDRRERRLERVVDGYDIVLDPVVTALGRRVHLSAVVTRLEWQRRRVRVHYVSGRTARHLAGRAAIVSVPLGVLQAAPRDAGAIAFDPPLAAKAAALSQLAMGNVIRVIVRFRRRFWAEESFATRRRAADLDQMAFLHTRDDAFHTCWTAYPDTAPLFVVWCGGPAARELSGLSRSALMQRALRALSTALRVSADRLQREVADVWTYDWINDPFARGVYSYQLVGGAEAPAALARPVDGTLFFAGEATDASGATGTVHGAIASGLRAASQVLRALRPVK